MLNPKKMEKMLSNHQKELDLLISKLESSNERPKLLLHACCGPCSSYVLEYLVKYFDITVLYYNPNIYPQEEYERRLSELKQLYTKFPPALEGKVQVVELPYNPEEFYEAVGTRNEPELATEPEKGERCRRCYEFRLKRAHAYATSCNYDYFCTTLSISPFKDAEKINIIGFALQNTPMVPEPTSVVPELCRRTPKWLPSDFKKKGGFKRSLEISQEYNLYRQQYCGCIYSIKNNPLETQK